MKKNLIFAKNLREKAELRKVTKLLPGWYRWWASKESLKKLLNSKFISKEYMSYLVKHLTKKRIYNKTYYYVYVGVAVKESIQERLNWHVNQKHSKTSVESGFLSTLRQTLSSLIAGNQYDEEATNDFIDTLFIEYYPIDYPIKSKEAKVLIEEIEKSELNSNVIPLNLRDNKNNVVKPFLKELSIARKIAKRGAK